MRRSDRLAHRLAVIPEHTKEVCKKITPNDRVISTSRPFDPGMVVKGKQEIWKKPRGLWYSCGDDWIHWCDVNNFGEGEQEYVYVLTLDLSKMIVIQNDAQMQAFDEKYKAPPVGTWGSAVTHIDWRKVANDYGGIEICPYNTYGRYKTAWYEPWDVPSGCVWDPAVLKDVKLLASPGGQNESL